jgi:hypothetical protein
MAMNTDVVFWVVIVLSSMVHLYMTSQPRTHHQSHETLCLNEFDSGVSGSTATDGM